MRSLLVVSLLGVAAALGCASSEGSGGGGGTAGSSGAAGASGTAGASAGTAGVSGTAGSGTAGAGVAGAGTAGAGTAGSSGGTAGVAGTAGASGSAGASGAAGATGAAGSAGTAGASGAAGAGVDGCDKSGWAFFASSTCSQTPCKNQNLSATQTDPANAVDGDPTTRYTSGKTQSGDELITITFASRVRLSGITLTTTTATDFPVAYLVETSADGATYMGFSPAVSGAGKPTLAITFPPTTMKAIKVSQTGVQPAGKTSWWSINEIDVTGCVRM